MHLVLSLVACLLGIRNGFVLQWYSQYKSRLLEFQDYRCYSKETHISGFFALLCVVIKNSHGDHMIINVIKIEGSAWTFGPVSPTGQVVELPVYSKGYFTH